MKEPTIKDLPLMDMDGLDPNDYHIVDMVPVAIVPVEPDEKHPDNYVTCVYFRAITRSVKIINIVTYLIPTQEELDLISKYPIYFENMNQSHQIAFGMSCMALDLYVADFQYLIESFEKPVFQLNAYLSSEYESVTPEQSVLFTLDPGPFLVTSEFCSFLINGPKDYATIEQNLTSNYHKSIENIHVVLAYDFIGIVEIVSKKRKDSTALLIIDIKDRFENNYRISIPFFLLNMKLPHQKANNTVFTNKIKEVSEDPNGYVTSTTADLRVKNMGKRYFTAHCEGENSVHLFLFNDQMMQTISDAIKDYLDL